MPERHLTPLLELDDELGQLLDATRLDAARRELHVAVHTLHTGPWEATRLAGANPEHIGLLVLEGVIAREVLVSDTVSTELLGPGDIVRPWRLGEGGTLLAHEIRWNVLARSRVALLDRRFGSALGRFPEVTAAIIDRVNERATRLTMTQAISQLNRVDRRLLALFWHMAERWGRMTPDGVAIPMTLSHRMLGQLVGARRPTVSTALSDLAKQGDLARRDDGTWLLTGEPVGIPTADVERIVPIRRHLLPEEPAPAADVPAQIVAMTGPPKVTVAPGLSEALAELRARTEAHVGSFAAAYQRTSALALQTGELRDQCQTTRRLVREARAAQRAAQSGA